MSEGFGGSSRDGGKFVVNIRNVVEWLKKKALDSVMREKFGRESARICKASCLLRERVVLTLS